MDVLKTAVGKCDSGDACGGTGQDKAQPDTHFGKHLNAPHAFAGRAELGNVSFLQNACVGRQQATHATQPQSPWRPLRSSSNRRTIRQIRHSGRSAETEEGGDGPSAECLAVLTTPDDSRLFGTDRAARLGRVVACVAGSGGFFSHRDSWRNHSPDGFPRIVRVGNPARKYLRADRELTGLHLAQ